MALCLSSERMTKLAFSPTRVAGIERLATFLPLAGRSYASKRNYDLPGHPHVSGLSPYLRHRMVSEDEVVTAVLTRHSPSAAEKFIQEVYWRRYWKGWLELRPSVWIAYQTGVKHALDRVAVEGGLRRDWEAACRGETGIACFDHWAQELTETGYLHNHARMWFASIWIFTLRLPWELGADFFLRHLLDGDPASNTLSWRWVGGLQTYGKTYLARASNIEKYTEGRFNPEGQLAGFAPALEGSPSPSIAPLPDLEVPKIGEPTGFLITEEDLSPGFLNMPPDAPIACLALPAALSPLAVAPMVHDFIQGALNDCVTRLGKTDCTQINPKQVANALIEWSGAHGLRQIVTAYPPVGPVASALDHAAPALKEAGLRLVRVMRQSDRSAWPSARQGFFKFKSQIPRLISELEDA